MYPVMQVPLARHNYSVFSILCNMPSILCQFLPLMLCVAILWTTTKLTRWTESMEVHHGTLRDFLRIYTYLCTMCARGATQCNLRNQDAANGHETEHF